MTKRKIEYWVIPPDADGEFVAHMEEVLETYEKAYDPDCPVVCMDEQPVQLIGETRVPIPATKEHPERVDYEYERLGTASIFMFAEPLSGFRQATARPRRTKEAFYEAFEPERARALVRRIEFCYTPKHGSWLNVAECELSAMTRQCLAHRRFGTIENLQSETAAWSTATREPTTEMLRANGFNSAGTALTGRGRSAGGLPLPSVADGRSHPVKTSHGVSQSSPATLRKVFRLLLNLHDAATMLKRLPFQC